MARLSERRVRTPPKNFTGELGEGRTGWETGAFTYAITDRAIAIVVAPGEEAGCTELAEGRHQANLELTRLRLTRLGIND